MSMYRRFVSEFSGLNKIPATSTSISFSLTDSYSKEQIVVATTSLLTIDKLSSEKLHECTQKALDSIRQLRR